MLFLTPGRSSSQYWSPRLECSMGVSKHLLLRKGISVWDIAFPCGSFTRVWVLSRCIFVPLNPSGCFLLVCFCSLNCRRAILLVFRCPQKELFSYTVHTGCVYGRRWAGSSYSAVLICLLYFEYEHLSSTYLSLDRNLDLYFAEYDSSVVESTCNAGDISLIPVSRRSTGEGIG